MSKVLDAILDSDGKVKVGDLEIEDAIVLTNGDGPSEGILLIQGGKIYYLTTNSSDLESALEEIVTALQNVASALTSIDGKATAGDNSVVTPLAASAVSAINTARTNLNTLKGNLK